jgi:hypothetical protein
LSLQIPNAVVKLPDLGDSIFLPSPFREAQRASTIERRNSVPATASSAFVAGAVADCKSALLGMNLIRRVSVHL